MAKPWTLCGQHGSMGSNRTGQCGNDLVLSCCSCFAPAYFNDDEHRDFMIHLNKGALPKYKCSLLVNFNHGSQRCCAIYVCYD